MTSRLTIWLLVAGAVALACGPRARDAVTGDSAAPRASAPEEGSVLASSLDVSVADDVRLTLHITNTADSTVELQFMSGQTHDFAVADSAGRELWRWSADRMYTQALQTRTLAAGESLTFEERWSPGDARGRFTATGLLTAASHPIEQRVEFSLP